jgi:hypothetical protein
MARSNFPVAHLSFKTLRNCNNFHSQLNSAWKGRRATYRGRHRELAVRLVGLANSNGPASGDMVAEQE